MSETKNSATGEQLRNHITYWHELSRNQVSFNREVTLLSFKGNSVIIQGKFV